MDEVWKHAIKAGKIVADKALEECDGTYVGIDLSYEFSVDGLNYKASYSIFWESSDYFDCSVEGVDNDYKKHECCIMF
jgi:hypothetical protein